MKHLKTFNESNSNLSASDFKIGDKIKITYSDPKVKPKGFRKNKGDDQILFGEIGDHFGDGVFILLKDPIKFYDVDKEERNKRSANPMGYGRNSISEIGYFELFDNEEPIPGLTFDNVEKI
jgi:hypothetical protein